MAVLRMRHLWWKIQKVDKMFLLDSFQECSVLINLLVSASIMSKGRIKYSTYIKLDAWIKILVIRSQIDRIIY